MAVTIIALFAAYSILFMASMIIGNRVYPNSLSLQKLGKKLLTAKQKQLSSNKVFVLFDKKIQEGATLTPTLILTFLILVKSVGMLILGATGLSLVMIPLQGTLTSALTQYSKKNGHSIEGIRKALFPQFITQIHLTLIGNLIGLKLIFDLYTNEIDQFFASTTFLFSLLIPLISSAITAYVEVNYFKENRESILR